MTGTAIDVCIASEDVRQRTTSELSGVGHGEEGCKKAIDSMENSHEARVTRGAMAMRIEVVVLVVDKSAGWCSINDDQSVRVSDRR